jgi:hypothetical protein
MILSQHGTHTAEDISPTASGRTLNALLLKPTEMPVRNIPNDHQYTVKLPYRNGGKYQVQPFGHPFFVIIEDDPRVPTVAVQVRPRTLYSILKK